MASTSSLWPWTATEAVGGQLARRHHPRTPKLSARWVCAAAGLVHAVSTALVGSQVYYDALRYGILQELSRHRSYYTRTGQIDDSFRKRFRTRLEQDRDGAVLMGWGRQQKISHTVVERVAHSCSVVPGLHAG